MWGERWPHARGIEEADAGVKDVEKGRVWNGLTHRPTGSVTAIDRKGAVMGSRSAGPECSRDCVELEVASDVRRPAGSWLHEAGVQERGLGRDRGDHGR